jgi:integrase
MRGRPRRGEGRREGSEGPRLFRGSIFLGGAGAVYEPRSAFDRSEPGRSAELESLYIEITRPILERYQRWLYYYRKTNGQPLGFRTQHTRLQSIKSFFQWMALQNHLLHNPASEIVLPRMEHRLPKYVLTAEEAEQIIQQADVTAPEGLRDRAILETFYSTGMRAWNWPT